MSKRSASEALPDEPTPEAPTKNMVCIDAFVQQWQSNMREAKVLEGRKEELMVSVNLWNRQLEENDANSAKGLKRRSGRGRPDSGETQSVCREPVEKLTNETEALRQKIAEAEEEILAGEDRCTALKKDCEDAMPALEVLRKGEHLKSRQHSALLTLHRRLAREESDHDTMQKAIGRK